MENKEKKPPENYKKDYDIESDKKSRKSIRLSIIKKVLMGCFYGLCIVSITILLDIFFFEKEIAQHPSIVTITTVLSSTLTTDLGAIIGSSID